MTVEFTLDGRSITADETASLPEIAGAHGVYLPTLCFQPGHEPTGTCRVCAIKINGQVVAGCTARPRDGAEIEVDTDELRALRRGILELLFAEGNHSCPSCEKSGRCQLQGVALETGLHASEFPYRYPTRETDHSDRRIWLVRDRCILCHRCVDRVHDDEGRHVFTMTGRGPEARIELDHELADTLSEEQVDAAVEMCPVGAILRAGVGYVEPIGERRFERETIRERMLGGELT